MDTKDLCAKLSEPFSAKDIDWKPGATKKNKEQGNKVEAALAMPYINSRAIMDRLDGSVGPENWEDRYTLTDKGVMCELRIRLDGEWISKSDGAPYSDVEPFKGSISGALKRAAVKWGVGRYLYTVPPRWVKHDGYKFLETPALPDEALPENERRANQKAPARSAPARPAAEPAAAKPEARRTPVAEVAAPAPAAAAPVVAEAAAAAEPAAASVEGAGVPVDGEMTEAESKIIDRVITRVKESGGSNRDAAKDFISNHTELSATAKTAAAKKLEEVLKGREQPA
jgi:hypothetical protein